MKNYLPTLDDMVFENRNKLYGAFELRKNYASSLRKATLLGAAAMLFVTGSSFIYYRSQPKVKVVKVELKPKNYPPPPKDKVADILPPPSPPPIEKMPPPVKQLAFLPPEPIPNELDIDEIVPPNVSDLENAQISNQNVEGVDATAIVFDAPPPASIFIKEKAESGIETLDLPFTTVEMMPEFAGGTSALYRWLGSNLHYPNAAVNAGIEGKVYLKFVVEKDGTISQLTVLKGIGFGCDEEALRTVSKMPKWNPGKQNGRAVRVYFTLPISFKLQ